MGVHIHIKDLQGNDHPKWDWIRHAGDKEFANFVFDMPMTEIEVEDNRYWRPLNIEYWRKLLTENKPEYNQNRFPDMLDYLEEDEKWYVYFSW